MKLLAENRQGFLRGIDPSFTLEKSIVCRYRNLVQLAEQPEDDFRLKEYLLQSCIREGSRIVSLMTYKDVLIHILDETSAMATGSLKSIDGCLTTAFCRMEESRRIAFESGGNTGSAFTQYGRKAGLTTFFFCPLDNIDLLDSNMYLEPDAHLVGVADRRQVKEMASLFSKITGIRHVPDKAWRHAAAMFRGLAILEHLLSDGQFDWLIQTVSAGFGPLGMYRTLDAFCSELEMVPRFLGIQQEANCPMFTSWKPDAAAQFSKAKTPGNRLLSRIMYDETPQTYKTFDDVRHLLQQTQGDLLTVNEEEFASFLQPSRKYGDILELLRTQNIVITLREGAILEKTGLIALAGTLKAIDSGTIRAGSRVLCCLTSGVSRADGNARPEAILSSENDALAYAQAMTGGS